MSVAIITDNSAILPISRFAGLERVQILALPIQNGLVSAPRVEDFARAYSEMEKNSSGILVLCSSSGFWPNASVANQAALSHPRRIPIQVLDVNNIGAGLGVLVQLAAQESAGGASLIAVERAVRVAMPHVFHVVCTPDASGLALHNLVHPAQASVFKHLNIFPAFSIEEGHLAPYAKIRTRRHVLESFLEFMEEFETPHSITLTRGPENTLRAKPLREAVVNLFPDTPFSELDMTPPLVALFGSQAAALTVLERQR